jgi:hypothetical protein
MARILAAITRALRDVTPNDGVHFHAGPRRVVT